MVLDVAPHPQVRRVLHGLMGGRYVGVDRFEDRAVDVWADLTQLSFRDGAFGLVVCYHVLEHIPDDAAAIAELRRVLAPGGFALIQVPLREGRATDEDPDAPDGERIRRFGQADHVRWYGEDFVDRLARGGLAAQSVRPRDLLGADALTSLAIMPDELVWIGCRCEDRAMLDGLRESVKVAAAAALRRRRLRFPLSDGLARGHAVIIRVARRVRRRAMRMPRSR